MWCKHSTSSCRWASALLAAALLVTPIAPARAAQCLEVAFQDSATVGSTNLVLNGLGLRKATMFSVKVYVAGLYLPAKSSDAGAILAASQPWRLELRFVRDVDASDIADAWEEGFEKSAGAGLAGLRERLDALKAMMVDFKEGHSLVFANEPASGVTVDVQGAMKGAIAGADFAAALLGIWLGPEPPNDDLKSGLLGGACE
jgi:hypothetical protein